MGKKNVQVSTKDLTDKCLLEQLEKSAAFYTFSQTAFKFNSSPNQNSEVFTFDPRTRVQKVNSFLKSLKYLRVSFYFKWFDFWVGLYFDKKLKTLYVGYFPMFGFKLYFRKIPISYTDITITVAPTKHGDLH